MPYIESHQIDATVTFEGYLWYSDEAQATYIQDVCFDKNWLSNFPYIVEGYLFSPDWGSLTIRWLDGAYQLWYVGSDELQKPGTEEVYLLQEGRLKDETAAPSIPKKAYFKTIWEPVPDEACCGFDVLKPITHVFIGFKAK